MNTYNLFGTIIRFLAFNSQVNTILGVRKFPISQKFSVLNQKLSQFSHEYFKKKFPLKVNEDIYLDKLKSQDTLELFELTDKNRPYLKKTLPWLDYSTTAKDSEDFISQENENFLNKSLILGIREKKLIGIISFNTIDWEKKEGEIGYWIDEKMQGKGIVTVSCKTLIDLGFSDLQLEKILISCSTQNIKSQLIAKRLGFQEECLIPNKEFLYDHYVDHILFSKTEKDYLEEQHVVVSGGGEDIL